MTPPSTGNSGLITIPVATTASISFAASNVVAYAGNYLVTVSAALLSSPSTIVASASITYTYVNPCLTATFSSNWGDYLTNANYLATVLGTPVTAA